jgi:hypothetical protein
MPVNLPAGFPVAFFASSGDEKSFYRAELRTLSTSIHTALQRNPDRETRAHLEAARDQIAEILDPKFLPLGTGPASVRILGLDWMHWSGQYFGDLNLDSDSLVTNDGNCWPDYQIRP